MKGNSCNHGRARSSNAYFLVPTFRSWTPENRAGTNPWEKLNPAYSRSGHRVRAIQLVVCSVLLYAPLASEQAWAVSLLLVFTVAGTISGLAFLRISCDHGLLMKQRFAHAGFLVCVVFSFIFPLYYRVYQLAGAVSFGPLPLPLEAYLAGIYSVMASMIVAFAYVLQAPAPGFTLGYRNFVKATILPTILVVPTFYAMLSSFFVTQILALVVAMSTDFVLSHTLIEAFVLLWWFFLTAVLLLFLKGHHSANRCYGKRRSASCS